MKDDKFENDRLGDILIEGERAGVASSDGEGEAEEVGEPLVDGILSGIVLAIINAQEDCGEDNCTE